MNELTTNDKTPDASRPPMNSVWLYVMLSRNFGSRIEYNAEKQELSARCRAEGYVSNTDSKFEGKRCSVTFCRDTTNRLAEFAREHRLRAACGSIEVAAGLEPVEALLISTGKFCRTIGGNPRQLPGLDLKGHDMAVIEPYCRFCGFQHGNVHHPQVIEMRHELVPAKAHRLYIGLEGVGILPDVPQ
jgi:hypothetical protein